MQDSKTNLITYLTTLHSYVCVYCMYVHVIATMFLKLSQVDDAHNDTYDDVLHCDEPTDTVPCNDEHRSDAASQNADNPAVCTNLGINIDRV